MPLSPKKVDKGKVKKDKADALAPQDYVPPPLPMPGDEFAMPVREVVKPDNQLRLTEAELNEEIARMLTANNPAAPKNVARFNMKERTYKFEPMVEQTIVHYATDGWLLHKGSEEARRQLDMDKMEQEAAARFANEVERAHHDRRGVGVGGGGEGEEDVPDDSRQLRNQFNFSERAAQTLNYPLRDRETFTEPPPTATVSGACTQWGIFDEYVRDLERQKLEESAKSKGGKKGGAAPAPTGGAGAGDTVPAAAKGDPMRSAHLGHCAKILDRMVNQNMFEEIAMDFKYWEDASDGFRPGEGSLLPLWEFGSDKSRRRQVTSLCWNPQYLDLFAVGYGSYDFLKQSSGLVNCYSLKNPSHPEFSFTTESGVMCLHFHPEHASLLAVGCYDGSVQVYDIRTRSGVPLYAATVRTGKHNDPVWGIAWQVDEAQKALQFVSISSDGAVNMWTMNKSELTHESLMKLKVVGGPAATTGTSRAVTPPTSSLSTAAGTGYTNVAASNGLLPDKSTVDGAAGAAGGGGGAAASANGGSGGAIAGGASAGGCCMDFKRFAGQEHMYLVGTEEGALHRCSKAYSSEYLSSYAGHSLAVYAVNWNRVHPRTFLSASADWSVKLWDSEQPSRPVLSFDLNDSVGDVAWSPYSATVFAAVTDDGKVHVFDLAESKLMPLASQKVVKKARLTRCAFNPVYPVLLVGDSRGNVTSLKLSPNLRKRCIPEKGQKETAADLEIAKLERVLDVARRSDPARAHAATAAAGGGSIPNGTSSTLGGTGGMNGTSTAAATKTPVTVA